MFNCPCEGHFTYGLAFLWAPALFIFLAGILLDQNLWKRRPRRDQEKKKTFARRYFKALIWTFDVLVRASIVPVAWLVFSFLQQQYYTCAYFGPPLESAVTMWNKSRKCHFDVGSRTKALEESFKTRSQIAGWSLMLIAMSVLFASVCIRRCIKKGRHLQIPSFEYYRHVEAKAALEHFHAKAKELAKKEAKKEIHVLFVKAAENKDFISCIEDVGKGIENKYGPFFEIPPESPSYTIPVNAAQDPPHSPTSPIVSGPLLSDRTDTASSLETQESICVDGAQCSLEASENTSGLARVKLHRQDAFDTSEK